MYKRAVSPVIATVLLISMVVVLAMIVILWFTSLTGEAITKFNGQNVEIICNDVSFEATYVGDVLSVLNTGSVPIYKINIKTEGPDGYQVIPIGDKENWPDKGLNQGKSFSVGNLPYSSKDKITIIPVLLGESSSKGLKTFSCDEKQTVYEININ